jgi:hypothetical protein
VRTHRLGIRSPTPPSYSNQAGNAVQTAPALNQSVRGIDGWVSSAEKSESGSASGSDGARQVRQGLATCRSQEGVDAGNKHQA